MRNALLKNKYIAYGIIATLFLGFAGSFTVVNAASENNEYYMGKTQKKDDAGYGEDTDIDSGDVHYGWDLGQFCVSGWTRRTQDKNGNPVFLKNVGDTVSLSFNLQQDIDELGGNDEYHISEDDNGYDEYFGITKDNRTNFGFGTLLIKKIDYKNKETNLQPYTNYLEGVKKGANTEVQLFEEGDYEVALDYEIQNNNFHFWGWRPFDGYTHYQILIKFSVRNGNCMAYPFDVSTKAELVNASFTENGFYIDLANSRYLNIDVKKQNYVEADGTLVEDTRFNKPASDGEQFTDEGIYIITVHNQYTDSETEKKIYVGTNPLLKAYVTTGQDLDYIKELLSEGATIEDDGTITLATKETIESTESEVEELPVNSTETVEQVVRENDKETPSYVNKIIIVSAVIVVCLIGIFIKIILSKKKKVTQVIEDPEEEVEEK